MNWYGCGKNRSWPNSRHHTSTLLQEMRKTTKSTVRIVSVLVRISSGNPQIQSRVSVLWTWYVGPVETRALDGVGTYTACSSSSFPICRDTVFSVPMESLIISSCSSCVLTMWFCCWSVSSKNWRFGLSSSFSSLEYLVVPWLVGTRTGLFSRRG
jgi:hypothetical protein